MVTEDASAFPRGFPQPGDTLDGKYALIRVLGRGGMGVVYEAEHLRLKQRCAIKMLAPEILEETELVHRFEREARASALLKGPHVTRVTDVATTHDGLPYIVMELLEGRDLDSELASRGRLPYPEAIDYLLQACAAVGEAHASGIIHRDLKPGNLFLARENEGVLVKVLDFGISKMITEVTKLTSAGAMMGTALYMSPEQLRSASTVDARSDIWSMGVILYELVSGEPPFTGSATQVAVAIVSEDAPHISKRVPIPPEVASIIHRMIAREPSARYDSIKELAAALAPFAPPDSVGAAVAAQLSRRVSSDRSLPVPAASSSARRLGAGAVDVDAQTIARDVSTNVSHEVNTASGKEGGTRKPLVLALAAIALLAVMATGVAAVTISRGSRGAAVPPPPVDVPTVVPSVVPTAAPGAEGSASVSAVPTAPTAAEAHAPSAKPTAGGRPPRPPGTPAAAASQPARPAPPPAPKSSGPQAPTTPQFL